MNDASAAATSPRRDWFPLAFVALAAVLALALRLPQIAGGLPAFLDEAWPFRQAFDMWGWGTGQTDLNPHRFHYPSFTFYLHFLLQKVQFATGSWGSPANYYVAFHTDPTPMVLPARIMGVLVELAGIVFIGIVGERLRRGAGVLAVLLLASSATLIASSRAIVTDVYMAAFAAAAVAAMLEYRARGSRAWLIVSVVCIGLAAGSKYPGAALVVPLAAVLWQRNGAKALGPWAVAAAGAFGVFLLTTPYALLDVQTFWTDMGFVRALPGAGHLGRLEGSSLGFHLANLLTNFGWPGALLVPVSLVLTAIAWRARGDAIVVWVALLVFALPIFFGRVEADRYIIPVLFFAAPLVTSALLELVTRVPQRFRALLSGALTALLVVPVLVNAAPAARGGSETTRLRAKQWCEANVDREQLIIQEAYAVPLHTRLEAIDMQGRRAFRAADAEVQDRFRQRPWFRVAQLPLSTVGPGTVRVETPDGRSELVQLVPHAADFNAIGYAPRLFFDADYVVTTSAVRGRFEGDAVRFRSIVELYALLDAHGQISARFTPGAGASGPEIVVYRVTDALREAIAAYAPLDPVWWSAVIPPQGRLTIESQLVASDERTGGEPRHEDGSLAMWVRLLDRMYATLVRPFAHPMSVNLAEIGKYEPARWFAFATVEVVPEDIEASLVYSTASVALGDAASALVIVERAMAATGSSGAVPVALRLEHAEVLIALGDPARARVELEGLIAEFGAEASASARAQTLLASMTAGDTLR